MGRWFAAGAAIAGGVLLVFAAGRRWRDTAAAAERWDAHDSRRRPVVDVQLS